MRDFRLRLCAQNTNFNCAGCVQRDSEPSSSMQMGLKNYFMAEYRDPETFEMKTFLDITTVDEFWEWHSLLFCPKLIFVQKLANGEAMERGAQNTLMTHNRLTSGFRMMQRRGKTIKCPLKEEWSAFAPECTGRTYLEGIFGNVAKEDFSGSAPDEQGNPVYKYTEFDVGAGIREGGYFEIFKDDPNECQRIEELKRQRWIDKFTEYYRLDFVVYNPNVGLFASINFKIEFDNTGILIPEYYSETLSATMYTSWTDMVRLGLEIVLVVWWLCKVLSHGWHAYHKAKREKRTFAYFDGSLNAFVCTQLFLYGETA